MIRDAPWTELPLIDLNPLQILELADDTGAPLTGFWPCRGGADRPCGACDGCQPWIAASLGDLPQVDQRRANDVLVTDFTTDRQAFFVVG